MKNYLKIGFVYFILLLSSQKLSAQTAGDYNKSGVAKYNASDYIGAIEDYNKAIDILKDTAGKSIISKTGSIIMLANTYSNRGNAEMQLKNNSKAMEDYNIAIELGSLEDYHHTYFNRGILKGNLGDYRGAISDFDKAVELTPKFADAYYYRGLAKAQLRNIEAACIDWSKAGELGNGTAYEKIKSNCN